MEARCNPSRQNFEGVNNAYLRKEPFKAKLAREMLQYHGFNARSLIVLIFRSGDLMLGHLVLVTEGKVQFSRKHADLLSLLCEPLAIGMSNTLEHLGQHQAERISSQGEQSKPITTLDEVVTKHIHLSLSKAEGKIHGKGGATE